MYGFNMEDCLIPLVFNGRHTIEYFLATGQIHYIFKPSLFFLIWILKKCMNDTTVYSFTKTRKMQDFCFEKSLYLANCDGHH